MTGRLLIAGGYGVVGRRIASLLAPHYPGRVVIGGRRVDVARREAARIDFGTQARDLDVNSHDSVAAALDGMDVVVSCVDQLEPHLLLLCAQNGLAYTDITPHLAFRSDIENVDTQARQSGARILMGAGMAPGIANVMAAWLAHHVESVQAIETTVLLSIGDEYGAASTEFLTETLTRPFRLFDRGKYRTVWPFTEPTQVAFSAPIGTRTAYLFPSSDVVSYPNTLGVSSAIGRYALNPNWIGGMASALVRYRLVRFLRGGMRKRDGGLMASLKRLSAGTHVFGIILTARGTAGSVSLELTGRHQADATASSGAELRRALAHDRVQPAGVS